MLVKEFAFGGVHNRGFFESPSFVNEAIKRGTRDTFYSLYDYDKSVIEYVRERKTLSGFDGDIYIGEDFILDIDPGDRGAGYAQEQTRELMSILDDIDCIYQVYFSGRGFHIHIPSTMFVYEPNPYLHYMVRKEMDSYGIYEIADSAVTDKTRLIRVEHTINGKSGLYKIPLTRDAMAQDIDQVMALAQTAQKPIPYDKDQPPVFNLTKYDIGEFASRRGDSLGASSVSVQSSSAEYRRLPDASHYPCINSMLRGADEGERHVTALRIAAHFRWRYREGLVKHLMSGWARSVGFDDNELDRIVESVYSGHGGDGIRYGCNDKIMDKHCSHACSLYKVKKSQSSVNFASLEMEMERFLKADIRPLDIGAQYGKKFPIFHGEFVVLQAPPKHQKTMLVVNWVNALKVPTLFLELEMSQRQIYTMFTQVEMGWNIDQIKEHYASPDRKSIASRFNNIHFDFGEYYSHELRAMIDTLPVRPELIVVDHLHKLKTKYSGDQIMGKVSTISNDLRRLAADTNIAVIAIAEIDKGSMKDGMHMGSAKGGVDLSYDANKVIGITNVLRDSDELIRYMDIKTFANREPEQLNIRLKVDPSTRRIYSED